MANFTRDNRRRANRQTPKMAERMPARPSPFERNRDSERDTTVASRLYDPPKQSWIRGAINSGARISGASTDRADEWGSFLRRHGMGPQMGSQTRQDDAISDYRAMAEAKGYEDYMSAYKRAMGIAAPERRAATGFDVFRDSSQRRAEQIFGQQGGQTESGGFDVFRDDSSRRAEKIFGTGGYQQQTPAGSRPMTEDERRRAGEERKREEARTLQEEYEAAERDYKLTRQIMDSREAGRTSASPSRLLQETGGTRSSGSRMLQELGSDPRSDEELRTAAEEAQARMQKAQEQLDAMGWDREHEIFQWEGREELIREYRTVQASIGRVEASGGEMATDEDWQNYNANKQRLEELRAELEEKDVAAGNGPSAYSRQDRGQNLFSGTLQNTWGNIANAVVTGADFSAKARALTLTPEQQMQAAFGGLDAQQQLEQQWAAYTAQETRESFDRMYEYADRIGEDAAAELASARSGLTKLGKAGMDIGQNVLEMGFDAGVGAVTGGGSLGSMFVRVFGQSAGEARKQGATLEQQVGYGAASGLIEVATEKLFDSVAGIYGKGAADDITESVVRRLAETPTGQTLLRAIIGAAEEGGEEVISDLFAPFAERIYNEEALGNYYLDALDPAEMLHDFLLGAAIGGFGSVGSVATGQSAAKNAENDYITAMYAERGETPGIRQEVRDRAALERARENPEAYGKENETEEAERVRDLQGTQDKMLLGAAFSSSGVTLTEQEQAEMADVLQKEGDAGRGDKIYGSLDAYRMGQEGRSMEETVQAAGERFGLTPEQARKAWGFGYSHQEGSTAAADISTEEGRRTVETAMEPLGSRASEAMELYQKGQDVGRYAAAMQKAALLYAAQGADATEIVRRAREGESADLVGMLTDEQAQLAQEIGQEKRQQRLEAVQAMAESRKAIREQAAGIREAGALTAQQLEATEAAIAEAKQTGQAAMDAYKETLQGLEEMVAADPKAEGSEAYERAYDDAIAQQSTVKAMQQEIRELEAKKLELLGKTPVHRKKGTISYAGGTYAGTTYKGVDPAKLDRQQKKVVAMVETLADAVNLDYVLVDDEEGGFGGAYEFGGRIFVNINSGRNVSGDFSQTMAAASLSHELTHFVQEYAPEQYQELKDFVTGEILKANPQRLAQLVEQQRRWESGRTLSYEQALDEVVANACQTMLMDSKAVARLARQNMSLAERIADYIEDWHNKVKAAFEGVDTSRGAVYEPLRAMEKSLDEMQRIWDEGLEAAAENRDAEATVREARADNVQESEKDARSAGNEKAATEGGQNQYIGVNAENADKDALATAERLLNEGEDAETVRQVTGWFKGMDGKWRFEIPGNELQWKDKYNPEKIGNRAMYVLREQHTLSEFFDSPKLFEAYPQLKDVKVSFVKDLGMPGASGAYNEDENRISLRLSFDVIDNPERVLDTISHEIQHVIQHMEGFTPGAEPSYWAMKQSALDRQIHNYEDLVDTAKKEIGVPEFVKKSLEMVGNGQRTMAEHWKALDEFVNSSSRGKDIRFFEKSLKALKEKRSKLDGSPFNLYLNTAGEIEARDAEFRRKFVTDSQYKGIKPKLGDENTVFAEGQFQRWDDTDGDTASESEGREVSYARIEAESKTVEETVRALQKLAEKQSGTIEKLQKRLQLTKTPEVRESDARKMAKNLIREYGSRSLDADSVAAELKALGDYVLQTDPGKLDAEEVKTRARAIAADLVQNAHEQVSFEEDTLNQIANDIKGKKYKIRPEMMGELDTADGFDKFRKRNFGTFTLARADSPSIDHSQYISVAQAYADLQANYGEAYFPDLANEGEEIQAIAEMARGAAPIEYNPFRHYMGEATEELANRIAMDTLDGVLRPVPATDADKAKSRRDALNQQIKQLKAEGKLKDQEAGRLWQTVYDLSMQLDKAQSKYKTLQVSADARAAQVKAEGRAREVEMQARERARAAKQLDKLKEHYREIQQNARERRNNTGTRRKIRKLIDDLNNRLAHPTEKKHVPREMVQQTVDILSMIDLDTGRGSKSLAEKIAKLRTMYDDYNQNERYGVVYDEATAQMLKELADAIGETPLQKMSESQLDTVYRALKSLTYVIDNAVKVKIGNEERNAFEMAREMTAETRGVPKAQTGWVKEGWIPSMLRADVMFDRLGGFKKNSTWMQMARLLNDGQLKATRLKMELSMPFAEIFQNEKALADFTGVNAWGRLDKSKLVDIGLRDADGNAVPVTHDIMVGIYMDLMNEDNRKHFIDTGKTIPNLAEYYAGRGGWGAGSVRTRGISERLSELNRDLDEAERSDYGDWAEQLREEIEDLRTEGERYADEVKTAIEKNLTDFDRAWIKASRQLMDVDSKRALNETTMEVYGIEKANVANYWPITTDPDYLSKPMETVTRDMNLENAGFMKERIGGANPTLALGTVQVVKSQIDRVSQYCGIMPAVRSFGKVWNKTEAGYADSIKKAVRETFNNSGVKYVENLIADLQGGRRQDSDTLGLDKVLGSLRGNLAQTTLTLNLRVAMAQAASYPTAAAELGYGPLAKALAKGGKGGHMISPADQELIAKWSPLLYHRMLGYSSPELGDIQSSNSPTSRLWRKARFVTGWIQYVDGATVGRLWYASEYWVQANKPTLQKGSDAYYEAVAEKFNDVVEKTQPNYTVMQRAAILRSPSTLVKTFTMFMTQRMQNFNILYDAAGRYQKARADFANKRNGVTREDVAEARNGAVRAVTSQIAQTTVFVAFKLLADALLHNDKKYRDKETGDLTVESVSKAVLDAYLDAFMGTFILGSELYGAVKAVTGVSKWYGLSVSGVDTINDTVEALAKLREYDWSDPEQRKKALKQCSVLGQNVAQALGIPLANGVKIGQAVFAWIDDARNGNLGKFESGYERTTSQEKYRAAMEAGIPKNTYRMVITEADANGKNGVSQEELGRYFMDAIPAGKLTEEQADIIWGLQGWSSTRESWNASAAKAAEKAKWQEHLDAANVDGKGVTQAELSAYLQKEIRAGRVTEAEAEEIWKVAGPTWKKTFAQYAAQAEPTRGMPGNDVTRGGLADREQAVASSGIHTREKRIGEGTARVERGREIYTTEEALARKHAREQAEDAETLAAMDQSADEAWAEYVANNAGSVSYTDYLEDPRIDPEDAAEYQQAQQEHAVVYSQYQAGAISQEEYDEKATVLSDYLEAYDGNSKLLDYLEDPRIPAEEREDYLAAYQDFRDVYRRYQAGAINFEEYTNETEGLWERIWAFWDTCSEIRNRQEAPPDLQLVDAQGRPLRNGR